MNLSDSMKKNLERIIITLTLLGLFTTIHLWLMSERGFDRGCMGFSTNAAVEETFNCKLVFESEMSTMLGISNVFWGMMFYAVLTLLNLLIYFTYDRLQRVIRTVRLLNITIGAIYSILLSSYQVFWIESLCALCLTSATILLLLFVTSIIYWKAFPIALTVPHSHLWFFSLTMIIIMFLSVGDILYFNPIGKEGSLTRKLGIDFESILAELNPPKTEKDTPVDIDCLYDEDKPLLTNYKELITHFDIKKGKLDSDIIFIEYFDPNCVHCKELHDVMLEAVDRFGDKVLFVFKPNPLWRQSAIQIQALHIASEEDLFFEMLRKQFVFQSPSTGLNLEGILEIAKDIGMDHIELAKRMNRGDYLHYIMNEYEIRRSNKINAVPSVIINGKTVDSKSLTLECFETFINDIE